MAECCDLMNMQKVFINMLEEPEAIQQHIDICMQQGIAFAKAQVEAGADMVDLDYMVDMDTVAQILLKDCCICGNFDPVEVMLQGTPEMVEAEARRCMQLSSKNHNFVAPGCEIPKNTPVENILAMKNALET